MTAVKTKNEYKTIIDFSNLKVSKNLIRRELRKIEVNYSYISNFNTIKIINTIKIGEYTIRLYLTNYSNCLFGKLKKFGPFYINIYDHDKRINLLNNTAFKNEYWNKINNKFQIRTKNLIDIIMYCYKLNQLQVFL